MVTRPVPQGVANTIVPESFDSRSSDPGSGCLSLNRLESERHGPLYHLQTIASGISVTAENKLRSTIPP